MYICPYFQRSLLPPQLAIAIMKGIYNGKNIEGYVKFIEVPNGTEVITEITGLPNYKAGDANTQPIGPHGFHIHDGGSCEKDKDMNFGAAKGHWNPTGQPHGNHAGDFPVLFSNNGYSKMSFFTNKFSVVDVIGKSVIIHLNPDDYRSEPSGNSGERIACGVIVRIDRSL